MIPGLTSDNFYLTMNPIVRVVSKVVGCGRMLLIEPDLEAVRGEGLTNAVALEMVSYEDFVAIKTGGAEPAAALRILEAVRRVPDTRLTAEEFVALRAALAGDDAFRDAQTQVCMGELERLWTPAERAGFAGDLRVDPQRVVHTYCARLQSAIASGRLGYGDWLGLIDMDRHPIARERAIQVLRDEPDGRHAFSGVIRPSFGGACWDQTPGRNLRV